MSNEKKYKDMVYIQRESSSSKRNVYLEKHQLITQESFYSLCNELTAISSCSFDVYLLHPNH